MHKRFDHKKIEKTWQKKWREDSLYDVPSRDPNKEKEYVLVEWPYPSETYTLAIGMRLQYLIYMFD